MELFKFLSVFSIFLCFFFIPGQPKLAYKLYKNRKRGINLFYRGYMYRKKAYFRSSVNWVCAKAPFRDETNKVVWCPGRCVTNEDGSIHLSKKPHNHLPVVVSADHQYTLSDLTENVDEAAYTTANLDENTSFSAEYTE